MKTVFSDLIPFPIVLASMYTQWYSDILLRRVSAGHICFSGTLKSFVSLTAEGAIPFNAEEFSDPTGKLKF